MQSIREDAARELKVLVVGDPQVGKSSLIACCERNEHNTLSSGAEPERYYLQFTRGDAERGMRSRPYHGTAAVVICFDLTDANTFKRLHWWFLQTSMSGTDAPVVLVGCKADVVKRRAVLERRVHSFLKRIRPGTAYIEASAHENINMMELELVVRHDIGALARYASLHSDGVRFCTAQRESVLLAMGCMHVLREGWWGALPYELFKIIALLVRDVPFGVGVWPSRCTCRSQARVSSSSNVIEKDRESSSNVIEKDRERELAGGHSEAEDTSGQRLCTLC